MAGARHRTVAKLPARLTLPSGAVLSLRMVSPCEGTGAGEPLAREKGAPLFSEAIQALTPPQGRVSLLKDGERILPGKLPLRDFHVLRAVLARSGVIAEEEVDISCRNCGAPMKVRPCAALEIGPWLDGELDDPELDATLPFGEPIDIPEIPLGRVRTARTVTLEDRTVDEARELFVAAAREEHAVTPAVVRAMGISALGAEKSPDRIATALAECDDEAFVAVCDAFLATHYVMRLGCVVFCERCGARNDVDAPYERESASGGGGDDRGERVGASHGDTFPDFEAFAARAKEIARPMLEAVPGEPAQLVIDGETPAVDDGGEPLLGSYVPPHPGDSGTPTQSPLVTVYYRTFRAMWQEDGPFDWEDELSETIEHELDHHIAFLRGDDPTDDEERAEIREEAVRIVGRREAGRRAIEGFGASWTDFLRRTWPLWVLALLALLFMLATQR
jgi:hypothetical protein